MLKKKSIFIGFGLVIAVAAAGLIMTAQFFNTPGMSLASLFNAGMDVLGAFVCAVLFYGCMGQVENSTRSFSLLVLMTSASFFINEVMWLTAGIAEWRILYFACCILSKWLNLAMIFFFYTYVKQTLGFGGKLVRTADRLLPALLIASMLIVLANAFFPLSFTVNADGVYSPAGLSWLEDIYLAVASVIATVLIFRSNNPQRQKWAAMSFILIPVVEFLASGGAFAYAAQYAAVLLSLILMYCILFNDRSRKLASTQTELNMATQIQKSMLPAIFPAFPDIEEIDLYASMDPAREVGGDFYDFFMIDDDHIGLIIADVSGKGVPAALFMMICKTIIQNYAKLKLSASEVLHRSNEAICNQNKTEMFVTTWIGILEISSGRLNCSNAGHEYPVICKNGRFELLKDRHGFVLGGMESSVYRDYQVELGKGDKIFVYTDGVPEATNHDKEMFGTDRMIETLNNNAKADPKSILTAVSESVDNFVGEAEQFDDLTMLCLEYK